MKKIFSKDNEIFCILAEIQNLKIMKRMYFITVVAIGIMTAIGCSKSNPVPAMEDNSLSADDCNCGIITKIVDVRTHHYDNPDTVFVKSTIMVKNECSGVVEKFRINGDYKEKESGYICFDEAW